MVKDTPQKWFAVLNGQEGPCIYGSEEEFDLAKAGINGVCIYQVWHNYNAAVNWLKREAGPGWYLDVPDKAPQALQRDSSMISVDAAPEKACAQASQESDSTVHQESGEIGEAAPEPPSVPEVKLSLEQIRVLELVMSGKNVFFTGPAGTGKSLLLREIVHHLRATGKVVAVTATTGIAALHIGGRTIHSWAGVRLSNPKIKVLVERIKNPDPGKTEVRDRWTQTQVLIIDEISMMEGRLFDKLETIARLVRKSYSPFGGMQLVLCGDFYQLPPVEDSSYKWKLHSLLAFEARSWHRCIEHTSIIRLKQVFRQNNEMFLEILGAMRKAQLKVEHIRVLQSLSRPLAYEDGIEPTFLFPKKDDASRCNHERLDAMPGPIHTFTGQDSIGYDYEGNPIPEKDAQDLLDKLTVQPSICLKIGAQVMLLKNVIQGTLVNGSIGWVEDFVTVHAALEKQIQVANPKLAEEEEQYMKSQLKDFGNSKFLPKGDTYPLVVFPDPHIKGKEIRLLCAPLEFAAEGFMGNIEVHRYQVPLALAWAMSIHKSQGQTLNRVKIDLGQTFEKGQAYVAISRAKEMDTLEIVNFDPGKVMVHPKVVKWERDLERSMLETEMDTEEATHAYWTVGP